MSFLVFFYSLNSRLSRVFTELDRILMGCPTRLAVEVVSSGRYRDFILGKKTLRTRTAGYWLAGFYAFVCYFLSRAKPHLTGLPSFTRFFGPTT